MEHHDRGVLLVGSMPFADEESAMALAMDLVGDRLLALPDGEIGERTEACPGGHRSAWVQTIMDKCEADAANFELKRPARRNRGGYAADYQSGPRLKPKLPPKQIAQHLDFGWASDARRNYPIFQQVRAAFDRSDLKFQVGLPTGMGATFGMMDPISALRYADAFSERMATEANEILGFTEPGDVVFQVEVPGELAAAYRLPKRLAGQVAQRVINLVARIDAGASVGVHLCFGDLNNEALIKAASLEKAVNFSNELVARWPGTHELPYIHFPLAEAADPPPLERQFYAPLADLNLPSGTRLVAGFVHDRLTDDELLQIRGYVEAVRGGPVDVACSCGLGRRDPATAEAMIRACEIVAR